MRVICLSFEVQGYDDEACLLLEVISGRVNSALVPTHSTLPDVHGSLYIEVMASVRDRTHVTYAPVSQPRVENSRARFVGNSGVPVRGGVSCGRL